MMRRKDARGFSLIEMLIVLGIASILLRIALPVYGGIRRESIASQAAGDFNTVRAAAITQYEASGNYAADAASGVVPVNMGPYLPKDFAFVRPQYTLDWENFAVSDTSVGSSLTGQVLALTVSTPDSLLGLQILRTLGANCSHWSVGGSHTFVIQSTLESPY